MKSGRTQQWLAKAATGLALAFSLGTSWAVPDQTLGTFEYDLTGFFTWGRGWGGDTAVEWNSAGNPDGCLVARGLLESTNSDTPVCIYAVNNGNPWWHPDPTFDISQYKSIEFDIKWNNDPTNIPLNDFNYPKGDPDSWATSGIEIGAIDTNADNVVIKGMPIPDAAAGAWTHVSIPIDPTVPGLGEVYGLWFRKWICNPPANPGDWQTGHVVTNSGYYEFYIDNVVLIGGDVLPPPTMGAPVAATPGQNFIASSPGQYDRQEIRTVATNYSWIGASGPVTYSVDVAKIGDSDAPAILFFHWIPGGADANNNASDWHEPNVLMWRIGNNADGTAYSSLHYKTNAPDSNGVLYDVGNLGGPGSATYKGTWSITFDGDTGVTITSSDGTTFTTNLPPEVITIFAASPGMQVNIGHVPDSGPTPVGQLSVITRAKFEGTPATIDSNFLLAAPDTNIWTAMPNGPNGVQWLPSTSPFWLSWTLPANGFTLQAKAALDAGSWNTITPWGFDAGGKHHVLLSTTDIPDQNSSYFRLIKRLPSKLQVLLPGETAAPGTPTGKTGTPADQILGVPFMVVVNIVDDDWNIITGASHAVELSCSDNAALYLPATQTLSNGTTSFDTGGFLLQGSFVFTASDLTATNIAAGVSSSVTCN